MKDIGYIIADNVRLNRKRESLTQAELTERAELSLDSIKRIEDGKRTMSLENFIRLSDAIHVQLSFLLYEQKEDMSDIEQISYVLKGRSAKERKYLLYMLQEKAKLI